MNLLLEITCINGTDVDLEVLFTVSNGFGSCFLFKSLSNEFVYRFVGLQRLIFVVNLGIFTVFWKILGFSGRMRTARREEREASWKNEGKRVINLLYKALDRVGSDPIQRPVFWTPRLDPDGSGSIERSWSILEIRIHPQRGCGPGSLGFFQPIFSFLDFLLCSPLFLLFGLPVHSILFYKKLQKLLRVLGMFVTIFVVFLHVGNW